MNINKGYQIYEPNIFVPWHINEKSLIELFSNGPLKCVTDGYHAINCVPLNGLNCVLGFHFEPAAGLLNELEFFRTSYADQQKSFDEFQECFVREFGAPTITNPGSEGFNTYEWSFDNVKIIHLIYDRFGLEEHMRIQFINEVN